MKRVLCVVLAIALLGPAIDSAPAQPAYADPAVDAKIQLVWPHDGQGRGAPVETAPFANVLVYLFERGTMNPVSCSFSHRVVSRWALNSVYAYTGTSHLLPAHNEAVGQRIMIRVGDRTFPAWVFNNVPLVLPRGSDPALSKLYFFVEVEGANSRTNVWAHGADPTTLYRYSLPPWRVGGPPLNKADAIIQVVWPHDPQGNQRPVSEADLANVAVDLFEHPVESDQSSVGFGFDRPVRLLQAHNNGFLEVVKPADTVVTVTNELLRGSPIIRYPRWIFNDVDVSAAKDPLNKYYFAIKVDGVETHTTIWAHGADARTYFPNRTFRSTVARTNPRLKRALAAAPLFSPPRFSRRG